MKSVIQMKWVPPAKDTSPSLQGNKVIFTMRPRSNVHFYVATKKIRLDRTSSTYSMSRSEVIRDSSNFAEVVNVIFKTYSDIRT